MKPTPTENTIPLRTGGFSSLVEALDYAARGETGFNFYRGDSQLQDVLTYRDLVKRARQAANRLRALGLKRGARVALIADTDPDFVTLFFACQYAAAVPVPLPAPNSLGGRLAYEALLKRLLEIARAVVAFAPQGYFKYLFEAAKGLKLRFFWDPGNV